MITLTIYIVDDEPTVREGICMALESDYQMAAYGTAEAALKAMNKNRPDLVPLDIGLPGMNGVDALKEI